MLSQYIDYLSRWDVNVMPAMIVVGIINTKRTRDLTPTESIINYFGKPDTKVPTPWMKPSGGNEQFCNSSGGANALHWRVNYKAQPFKIFAGILFAGWHLLIVC